MFNMFNFKFKKINIYFSLFLVFFIILGNVLFLNNNNNNNNNNNVNLNYYHHNNEYLKKSLNLNNKEIKFYVLGENHSGLVTNEDGKDHLYMWGGNQFGQIGSGFNNGKNILFPTEINVDRGPEGIEGTITNLSLGYRHSGVVIEDENGKNHLYMWGSNDYKQISNELNNSFFETPFEINVDGGPKGIEGTITNLSLGNNNSAIVIKDNYKKSHLFVWGDSNENIIEINNDGWGDSKIQGTIKNLSLGNSYFSAVIIDNDNIDHLFMWGENENGQLGNNSTNDSNSPIEINVDDGSKGIEGTITNLSLGGRHSSVVIKDNDEIDHLYMWGKNSNNQLGVEDVGNNVLTPIEINVDDGDPGIQGTITNLSLGQFHSGVVIKDNDEIDHLYMWGKNEKGEIGNNSNQNQKTPIEINKNGWGDLNVQGKIMNLSLGNGHSGVVINDEKNYHIFSWGNNDFGQLGNGDIKSFSVPIEITPSLEIEAIIVDQNTHTFSINWNLQKSKNSKQKLQEFNLTGEGIGINNSVDLINYDFGKNSYTIQSLNVDVYDDWKINYSTDFWNDSIRLNDFILNDEIDFSEPQFFIEGETKITMDISQIKKRNTKIIDDEITISGNNISTQIINLNNEENIYTIIINDLEQNTNYNLNVNYNLVNDSLINDYVFSKNALQNLTFITPMKLLKPELSIISYGFDNVSLSFKSYASWGISNPKIKYYIKIYDVKKNDLKFIQETYDNTITISGLDYNTKYRCIVYADDENNGNQSFISEVQFKTKDSYSYLNYLILFLILIIVLMIIVMIIVMINKRFAKNDFMKIK